MYNEEYFSILSDNLDILKCIIMPPTSFNQSRRSINLRHVTAYFESKVYPTSTIGNGNPLKMPIIG